MPQCPPRWDEKFIPTQEVSPSGITKITPVDYSTGFFYAPVSPPLGREVYTDAGGKSQRDYNENSKNQEHPSFAKATEDRQDPKKH